MAVSATSPVNQTQTANDTTATGRTRLAENFDMFLTLLTTQLKNQDPTAPMDSNQFMAQLVQMTSVEQQLAGNDLLKQLVANTSTNLGNVVSLIGKEVRADVADAKLSNGQAKWGYNLAAAAADVKIEVLDSRGFPVRTVALDADASAAGDHSFVWDGKSDNGEAQPDGVYTLRVTAKDSSGETVTSTTFIEGLVTGVEQADGLGLVTVNGGKVALSSISSIRSPSDAAATDPNPTDQTST